MPDSVTQWTAACQASLSFTVSWSFSNSCALRQWCYLTVSSSVAHLLLLLPSVFLSIRVFSSELALCIRWPKYWSFSISPSSEYSELISFRVDWFDLLAGQRSLRSLLQHHSSRASILWHSGFMVQPSHLYMTTGKTIVLTIWAFVGKVMTFVSKVVWFTFEHL